MIVCDIEHRIDSRSIRNQEKAQRGMTDEAAGCLPRKRMMCVPSSPAAAATVAARTQKTAAASDKAMVRPRFAAVRLGWPGNSAAASESELASIARVATQAGAGHSDLD